MRIFFLKILSINLFILLLANKSLNTDLALWSAAKEGENKVVVKLLNKKKVNINFRHPQSDTTALQEAIIKGHTMIALILIDHGAKTSYQIEQTPQKKFSQIKLLTKDKKNFRKKFIKKTNNLVSSSAISTSYALPPSCKRRNNNLSDLFELSPIYLAVTHSNYEVFNQLLKEHCPKILINIDNKDENILHIIARKQEVDMMRIILDKSFRSKITLYENNTIKQALSQVNLRGFFPLDEALIATKNDLTIARKLIKLGANINIKNKHQFSSYRLAKILGKQNVVIKNFVDLELLPWKHQRKNSKYQRGKASSSEPNEFLDYWFTNGVYLGKKHQFIDHYLSPNNFNNNEEDKQDMCFSGYSFKEATFCSAAKCDKNTQQYMYRKLMPIKTILVSQDSCDALQEELQEVKLEKVIKNIK
jgi:ankyrin repeat protein